MPEIAQQCNRKSNIFNDMRAIVGMDLTRNEMKVLTVYRIEMDEATRQVRGKSQEQLREMTGLCRSQFSEASGCLQRRGLITVKRARNAPQLITVSDIVSEHQEVRETRMSGNPVIPDSGSLEIPDSGSPGFPGDDILAAPVSTPVSSPGRPSANDELHRLAYEAGLALKGGKVAKSARAERRTKGELDGSRGITFADGELTVDELTAARIRQRFPGVDVSAACAKAAAEIARMSYPTRDDAAAVIGKWAQITIENRKTAAPAGALMIDGKPFKVTGPRYAKPAPEVANA